MSTETTETNSESGKRGAPLSCRLHWDDESLAKGVKRLMRVLAKADPPLPTKEPGDLDDEAMIRYAAALTLVASVIEEGSTGGAIVLGNLTLTGDHTGEFDEPRSGGTWKVTVELMEDETKTGEQE